MATTHNSSGAVASETFANHHGNNNHRHHHAGGANNAGSGHGNHHLHHVHQNRFHRDLTPSEERLLVEIRRRKAELLAEIAQLQDEIQAVSVQFSTATSGSNGCTGGGGGNLHLQHRKASSGKGGKCVSVPLAESEDEHAEVAVATNEPNGGGNPVAQQPAASALSSASSETKPDVTKVMSLGCKKFNMDPKKGIEFLQGNGLLGQSTGDVAQFLYRGEGLNKTAIGDYLGEKAEFNELVLKAFVDLHDFTDLLLVQALRQFLWSFRLPGEAQKIDRMMECFARRYCELNPGIFTNTDTCYVLSFAIIMLNTSLHNQAVKEKPSVEQFVSMNRGVNNGGDLPRQLLVSMYNSIQAEPFKIPEDDGNDLMHTFFNPDKEGWLLKQGGRYKSWKRRWFILNDNCLYYFEFTTDKEPRGIIPLENVGVREVNSVAKATGTAASHPFVFEIYARGGNTVIKACKTDSDGRVVEGRHAVYRMSATSAEDRSSWVKSLRQSISYSPFYELLLGNGKQSGGKNSNSNSNSSGKRAA